jgi:glycosyltransferase involved in cell wall biosynthesis
MVAGELLSPLTRPAGRPLRVLHCPELVGGLPGELARAERALGAESWAVAFEPSVYEYAIDEVLYPTPTGRLTREWRRWGLLRRALTRFDVIHFNFGRTIMPDRTFDPPGQGRVGRFVRRLYAGLFELADVGLLKRMGKAVFVTFQGDDLRQGAFCEQHFGPEFVKELPAGYYSPETDARKQRRIAHLAKKTDGLYTVNPDLMYLLPASARFLPYGHIDPRNWAFAPLPPVTEDGPLVLHAPTHREVKGTRFVLDAVNKLKAEGIKFRFQLVEGIPRAEARRLFEQAHILIDQLWLGWYGGLAVELMALGRPVICSIRADGLKFLAPGMADDLPIIRAEPESVAKVMRDWLTERRPALPKQGEQSRRYVEKWHDPREVARGLLADYDAAIRRAESAK